MEKTILHIDMNAFFASVEQAANPSLRGQPIAVGGGIKKGSVVAACSYEAKAYGVKNAMSTWEARKLCPHLIVIIGDMTKYIYTSKVITRMLLMFFFLNPLLLGFLLVLIRRYLISNFG